MTPNPTNDDPTHNDPARGEPFASGAAPESRGTRSLTDRSKVEEMPADETADQEERRPRIWPRVVGVLILLIGVGGAWIWQNPGFVQNSLGSLFPGSASPDTDAAAIKTLEARVTRLEQRPAPADLTALAQRLDELETRSSPTGQSTGSGNQPAVDLRPLVARLDAVEARLNNLPPAPRASLTQGELELGPLTARLDALAAQIQQLTARDPAGEFAGKLSQMERQVSGLAADNAKLAEGSDRAVRLAQMQAADIALAFGHPLGVIADAPPALARFATTAPPTLATLRLTFSPAANAALKVSLPDTEGKSFLGGILARLQDFRLITVREGDRVLVGNAASAILAHAQMLLEAGDLAGAAHEVATLTGPPAEKMAPWLADATALVAARDALASLAERG